MYEEFLQRTEEFGLATGPEVAVVLPVSGFENNVLGDLNDEINSPLQRFYMTNLREHLPGLLVTKFPVDSDRAINGAVFFSFNSPGHPFRAAKALVKKIVEEPENGKFLNFLSHLNKIVILQPNFNGIGIDINALIDNTLEALRRKDF